MKNTIYQFKITLQDIEPRIWRRILVPADYTFWDLHVAIQDAMGWWDAHLHAFEFPDQELYEDMVIGIPEEDFFDEPETLPGWQFHIKDLFQEPGANALYEYDYGDSWLHLVEFEGEMPRTKGQRYPQCIDGARKCPPEDCGGVYGYLRMLEVISNPEHEEYDEMLTWLGGGYDPEQFDPKKIKFDNPHKRWEMVFSGE